MKKIWALISVFFIVLATLVNAAVVTTTIGGRPTSLIQSEQQMNMVTGSPASLAKEAEESEFPTDLYLTGGLGAGMNLNFQHPVKTQWSGLMEVRTRQGETTWMFCVGWGVDWCPGNWLVMDGDLAPKVIWVLELSDGDPLFFGLNANERAAARQAAIWNMVNGVSLDDGTPLNVFACARAIVVATQAIQPPIVPASLAITPESSKICQGGEYNLTFKVLDDEGLPMAGQNVGVKINDIVVAVAPTGADGTTTYTYVPDTGEDQVYAWLGFTLKKGKLYVKQGCQSLVLAVDCGGKLEARAKVEAIECAGQLDVKDATKVSGKEEIAWYIDKSGDSIKGCPGTYTLYSGVSVGYKKEEVKVLYNVTGPIEVSYVCTGTPGPANVTVIKDTLYAVVGIGRELVDQQGIVGTPFILNCAESKTDLNYSFTFAPVAGASGYVNVVVVYYNDGKTARFEAPFQLPVPEITNPCVKVWDQWQGQLDKLLGEVCIQDAPKIFPLDTTLTIEEPSLVNFINTAWLSSEVQTKASFQLEIIKCVQPDDFMVAIKVTDEKGNFIGEVEAYLYLPGGDPNKPWREASVAYQQLVWGKYPANVIFQNMWEIEVGEARLEIKAPIGWEVIGNNYFIFTITPEMAQDGVYIPEAHAFVLRKTSDIQSPELPAFDGKADLIYVPGSGTPTAKDEDWTNAVDGDYEGWDGTVTARGAGANPAGPASAVFQFGDGRAHSFEAVGIQTDNGTDDDLYNRQVTKIQVWISDDNSSWALLKSIYQNNGGYKYYPLGKVVSTKYIKLELLEPTWVSGNWRQLVEFKILSDGEKGYPAVESLETLETMLPGCILNQNYPNPFNLQTTIRFDLPEATHVALMIYNVTGKVAAKLFDGELEAGNHMFIWNASQMPSGIYFYEIKAGSYQQRMSMLLMK